MNQLCRELPCSQDDRESAAGDDVLVGRFLDSRDEAAFGELVRRYAPLVLGVCRRTLRHEHDAEEAFQAAFLVLAQKARRLRVAGSIGPWLYGVAYRIAIRAAQKRTRRREAALPEDMADLDDVLANVAECHWRRVLDDELNQLPEKFRSAVVMHYLLGKTNAEVAAELGLSVRTVEGRQRRGKAVLKHRLALRKVTLPAALGALAAMPALSASAAAPLVATTVATSLAFINGNSGACSSAAARLAQSEVMAMTSTVAPVSATLVTLLALGAGMALAGGDSPVHGNGAAPLQVAVQAAPSSGEAKEDLFGGTEEDVAVVHTAATAPAKPEDGEAAAYVENADGVDLHGKSDAEKQISASLVTKLRGPLDFNGLPLREVMQVIAEDYGVQVAFDHRALEEQAMSPDAEITIALKNVELRSALKLMLNDVDMDYLVKNDVLLITTRDAAAHAMETHVYDLRKPMQGLQVTVGDIVEMLPEAVAQDTWAENGGGNGSVRPYGEQAIVVNQSQAVHEEIGELLRQMQVHAERVRVPRGAGF